MAASVIPERNVLVTGIVKLAARAFLTSFFKLKIKGVENIPEKGAFVLLPRHQRWEDIPLVAVSVKRPLYYIAKQELFDNFISKEFIAMLGGLPLDRDRPARNRKTCSRLIQKLSEGEGVVVFPEGTYFKNHIGPGHPGLIRFIYENIKTLFIPVGISYRQEKIRINVRITFGAALKGSDFLNDKELFDSIMNQIVFLS